MSDDLVRAAAQRLRTRSAHRNSQRAERREQAQRVAQETAQVLGAADPTVTRIIGFGSTFETWRTFREDSDIDLGLEGGDWFLLSRSVPTTEFEISLIELDRQNADFSEHVRRYGRVLYERPDP